MSTDEAILKVRFPVVLDIHFPIKDRTIRTFGVKPYILHDGRKLEIEPYTVDDGEFNKELEEFKKNHEKTCK